MLRIHFMQHWLSLADLACEEALYDSASLRRFLGIDLGREPVPDATTMLKFRRLLNDNKLGKALFSPKWGKSCRPEASRSTLAPLWMPPSSAHPARPRMPARRATPRWRQTRKAQQWYFGMKLHIRVDSQSGLTHSAVVTAANATSIRCPDLLHGQERRVYGDSAYASQKALIGGKSPKAKDFTSQRTRHRCVHEGNEQARRPGQQPNGPQKGARSGTCFKRC